VIIKGYVSDVDVDSGTITIVVDGDTESYPQVDDRVEVNVTEEPATREEAFVEGFLEGRQE
jgi:hypothetical protein